ncbi:MAG: cysteine--tRNA ligase [Solirubrobacteraceae bacterium]|nr:cysteine--tRNA ligase [Solirubrobacteraceae bacterium]
MIRLYNSLSRQKEEFVPREEGKVGVYCCGPTVYNLVHVGNARPYVTFAVLRSWLRHRGYAATLVENITDVDDKIIAKAHAEGRTSAEIAEEYTRAYHDDMGRLGDALRPDLEPRATETIPEIVDLCRSLVSSGHAYEAEGSVYFRVRSFPEYGKLSGQRIEELEEGARVDAEPGKKDPLDFAIWKAAKPGEPAWESPWGMGRPGWHIECSAMGLRYLGAGFDVHGGGRDLIFPHHENEIAQSEAAGLPFARVWMHNGMIRSEGEKMAKSVGNIFLLREVLDRYGPAVLLMYFLTTHYRSPLEFSLEKLDEARAAYQRLAEALETAAFRLRTAERAAARGEVEGHGEQVARAREAFAAHMDDDLNTAGALGELFALASSMFKHLSAVDAAREPLDTVFLESVRGTIADSLEILLIPVPGSAAVAGATAAGGAAAGGEGTPVEDGAPSGAAAGAAAGSGRAGPSASVTLSEAGTVEGPAAESCVTGHVALPPERLAEEGRWEDLELVYAERLGCDDASYACALRDHYRAAKEWAKADEVRDALAAAGFEVRDTPQGTQVTRRG